MDGKYIGLPLPGFDEYSGAVRDGFEQLRFHVYCGEPVSFEVLDVSPEPDHELRLVVDEAEAARPRSLGNVLDVVPIDVESLDQEGLNVSQFNARRLKHRSMLRREPWLGVVHSNQAEVELAPECDVVQRPERRHDAQVNPCVDVGLEEVAYRCHRKWHHIAI